MEENNRIIRIALIGPESTGKTVLAQQLAEHFNTQWVPEFARSYIEKLDRSYTAEDILVVAKEQWKEETELLKTARRFIFSDTEMITSKVWCQDVFGFCHEWIPDNLAKEKHDFYLLTSPDIPWVKDAVRENPERREHFFERYQQELMQLGAAFEIVSGKGEERFQNALSAVIARTTEE